MMKDFQGGRVIKKLVSNSSHGQWHSISLKTMLILALTVLNKYVSVPVRFCLLFNVAVN